MTLRPVTIIRYMATASLIFLFALAAVCSDSRQVSLPKGPYPVGFRVLHEYDRTRPQLAGSFGETPRQAARPMQIAVWYPAATKGKRLTISDYVRLCATEVDFEPSAEREHACIDSFTSRLESYGSAPAEARQVLAMRTAAYGNARGVPGRWPIILFAHAAPASEALISEYLASYGFVVAAVVSKGTSQYAYRLSSADIATMTADLGFVLQALRQRPEFNDDRIAVIGMSNGAFAGVLLHARDARVTALVSLDGTIGERAAGRILPEDPNFSARTIRAATLHLYTPDNPYLDFSLLNSLDQAPRYLVEFKQMRHWEFLSYASYVGPAKANQQGFATVCRMTLSFLEHVLKSPSGQPWQPPKSAVAEFRFLPPGQSQPDK